PRRGHGTAPHGRPPPPCPEPPRPPRKPPPYPCSPPGRPRPGAADAGSCPSVAEPAGVEGLHLPEEPDERVGGPHHVLRRLHDGSWQQALRSGQGQPRRPHEAGMDEILGRTALDRPELLPPDLLVLEPRAR